MNNILQFYESLEVVGVVNIVTLFVSEFINFACLRFASFNLFLLSTSRLESSLLDLSLFDFEGELLGVVNGVLRALNFVGVFI